MSIAFPSANSDRQVVSPEMKDALRSLRYPFDVATILRKRKSLRRHLLEQSGLQDVRIALLGGSTTTEVRDLLELFLLDSGFRPAFFESEYNQFYDDAVLGNPALTQFMPSVALVFTSSRNITRWPDVFADAHAVNDSVERELARYRDVWDKLRENLGCVVIQNNFEIPGDRPLGPLDGTLEYGRTNYIARLNVEFARDARQRNWLVINDIHHQAALLGLQRWYDKAYWYTYKLAMSQEAAVHVAHGMSRLVGASLGRTRKCLVLDLDNTLWGGVIGDDGLGGLKLGRDSAVGEAYVEFQQYCLDLKKRGVLLAVSSKNEDAIAKSGFTHPDSVLRLEDFSAFEANWNPKSENIAKIASQLNLGLDSFVFIDDNPAEREIVSAQLPQVAVPNVGDDVTRYAEFIERQGYFDTVSLSADDAQRSEFYSDNSKRKEAESTFATYEDYLRSLEMVAEIAPFNPTYLPRIAQLTNKTNQFNLTTRRYTLAEMEDQAADPAWITLYGRLADKFGDNGLVSVVAGRREGDELQIELWLMSCRVLKRDFEIAMFDELLIRAHDLGIRTVVGQYLRTPKNAMVADHYQKLGFQCVDGSVEGDQSRWVLEVPTIVIRKNQFLKELVDGRHAA